MGVLKPAWREQWACDECGDTSTITFYADTPTVTPPIDCAHCGATITDAANCHASELARLHLRVFTTAMD